MKKVGTENDDTMAVVAVVWLVSLIYCFYNFGVLVFAYDEIEKRGTFFGGLSVAVFLALLSSFLIYIVLTRKEKTSEKPETETESTEE